MLTANCHSIPITPAPTCPTNPPVCPTFTHGQAQMARNNTHALAPTVSLGKIPLAINSSFSRVALVHQQFSAVNAAETFGVPGLIEYFQDESVHDGGLATRTHWDRICSGAVNQLKSCSSILSRNDLFMSLCCKTGAPKDPATQKQQQ